MLSALRPESLHTVTYNYYSMQSMQTILMSKISFQKGSRNTRKGYSTHKLYRVNYPRYMYMCMVQIHVHASYMYMYTWWYGGLYI